MKSPNFCLNHLKFPRTFLPNAQTIEIKKLEKVMCDAVHLALEDSDKAKLKPCMAEELRHKTLQLSVEEVCLVPERLGLL